MSIAGTRGHVVQRSGERRKKGMGRGGVRRLSTVGTKSAILVRQ